MRAIYLKVEVPDNIEYANPHEFVSKRYGMFKVNEIHPPTETEQLIMDEMDADMEESGMAQGEIVSCLNHWKNKYIIIRK